MKKILLVTAISLGSMTAFAQEQGKEVQYNQETEAVMQAEVQDDFEAIEISELPAAVTEALNSDFPDAEIQEAYVNSKEEYKLVVVTADGSTTELYADADGNWIEA